VNVINVHVYSISYIVNVVTIVCDYYDDQRDNQTVHR